MQAIQVWGQYDKKNLRRLCYKIFLRETAKIINQYCHTGSVQTKSKGMGL